MRPEVREEAVSGVTSLGPKCASACSLATLKRLYTRFCHTSTLSLSCRFATVQQGVPDQLCEGCVERCSYLADRGRKACSWFACCAEKKPPTRLRDHTCDLAIAKCVCHCAQPLSRRKRPARSRCSLPRHFLPLSLPFRLLLPLRMCFPCTRIHGFGIPKRTRFLTVAQTPLAWP